VTLGYIDQTPSQPDPILKVYKNPVTECEYMAYDAYCELDMEYFGYVCKVSPVIFGGF